MTQQRKLKMGEKYLFHNTKVKLIRVVSGRLRIRQSIVTEYLLMDKFGTKYTTHDLNTIKELHNGN